MMIETIMPRGSINEIEVRFLTQNERANKYYLVDSASNQWEIGIKEFEKLKFRGFMIKEVKFK